jgi:hemolysin III
MTHEFSLGEEIAHSLTHGLGAILSAIGLVVLIAEAVRFGNVWHIVSCAVFGVTLILLYTASTLYHSIPSPRAKRVLRYIDHSAIFLLIAGTYTPFTLVSLNGGWGWSLFGVIWGLALIGIVFKAVALGRFRILSVALYIVMGWIVAVALEPLARAVEPRGLLLLFLGGGAYTLGVIFYGWKRLAYNHAIWHVFVLTGSVLHYLAVLFYVIPRPH